MRKIYLLVLLASFCLLSSCSSSCPNNSQPFSAIAELKKPSVMQELAENSKVQWMAGMLAVLEDAEILRELSTEHYTVYAVHGEGIKANVTVQNGLNKTQQYALSVFADGVPMEFEVNGKLFKSYPVDLTPEQRTIPIEIGKDFVLNLGRLDFVMSYTENLQGSFHIVCQTLWVDVDGKAQVPTALCTVVEQREILRKKYNGDAYDAWIWEEGVIPIATDTTGPRELSLQDGETVLLEVMTTTPGLYRTVLVVGEMPVDFEWNGTQHSYLDWESTGTNMIQIPIQLKEIPPSGSIYTITTPLDADALAQPIVASRRIELNEEGEG